MLAAALLGCALPRAARAQPAGEPSAPPPAERGARDTDQRSGSAPADAPDRGMTAAVRTAREHFERGRDAYRAGRLKQAVAEFARAHELAPSPELEFDLARAYERTGEAEPAIRHYRGYLAQTGVPPGERTDIEARIRALQALLARQQAQVKAPPPSSDALTAEARAFFERGLTLFRRRQYAAALEAFAAARRFVPLPELAYNLALASERLGRNAEAVDHYRAYLRDAKHPDDEASVQSRIKNLLSSQSSSAKSSR